MAKTDYKFLVSPLRLIVEGELIATREDVLEAQDQGNLESFVETLIKEHGICSEDAQKFVEAVLEHDPDQENGVYRCDTEVPEDGDGGVEFIPVPEMTPDSYDMSDIEKMDAPTKHKLAAKWGGAVGYVESRPADPDHEELHHYEKHKDPE